MSQRNPGNAYPFSEYLVGFSCRYFQGLHIEGRPTSFPTRLCFRKFFLIADFHCVLLALGVGPSLLNYNSHLLPVQEIEMVFGAQL